MSRHDTGRVERNSIHIAVSIRFTHDQSVLSSILKMLYQSASCHDWRRGTACLSLDPLRFETRAQQGESGQAKADQVSKAPVGEVLGEWYKAHLPAIRQWTRDVSITCSRSAS